MGRCLRRGLGVRLEDLSGNMSGGFAVVGTEVDWRMIGHGNVLEEDVECNAGDEAVKDPPPPP